MNGDQIIDILKKNGWKLDHITGSHHHFKKDGYQGLVTVPLHGKKDIAYARKILKDAGIDMGRRR
jgi:predicted RNA binding protein YcfA (HicA-like mRNA interferase family)